MRRSRKVIQKIYKEIYSFPNSLFGKTSIQSNLVTKNSVIY